MLVVRVLNSLVCITTTCRLLQFRLKMESVLAKHTLAKKTMESIADVFKELSPLMEAFPTLLKLLQIALTICVSSASFERSFSALKRIKTYLRSTMHEERLVNLAVLARDFTNPQFGERYRQILYT